MNKPLDKTHDRYAITLRGINKIERDDFDMTDDPEAEFLDFLEDHGITTYEDVPGVQTFIPNGTWDVAVTIFTYNE